MNTIDELTALAKEASQKKAAAIKRHYRAQGSYYYDPRHKISAARWDGMAKAYRKAAKMVGEAK